MNRSDKPKPYIWIISLLILFLAGFEATCALNIDESPLQKQKQLNSQKANTLIKKAREVKDTDKAKAIVYYSKALTYETDKFTNASILDTIGLYYWQLGDLNKAIENFKSSLVLFEELNDSIWLGKVLNNIAVTNWGLGNSNEALNYYQRALPIRKAIGDHKGVSNILNNIGLIYQGWGLYDEALKWHNQALSAAQKTNNLNAIAYSQSNIGKYYEYKSDFQTALTYHKKGYENLLKQDKNNRSISFFLVNTGSVFSKNNQLDSALHYYNNALFHAKRINNKNRIAIAEYFLGNTYLKLNRLDSANLHLNKSFALATKNNYNVLVKDNLFAYADLAEKRGQTTEALNHYKHATALKDSIFNSDKIAKFTDLQIRYNLDQQKQENLLLRKNIEIQNLVIKEQNITTVILIVSGFITLFILALILRSRKSFKNLSIKLQTSEKELQELNASKDKFFSIISHDLKAPFNGLMGITDVLQSDFESLPKDKIKELLALQKETSTNTYNLLESLLQWASTQNGRMKFNIASIDLHSICKNTKRLLKTNYQSKNIELICNVPKDTFVMADKKALSTVTRNILSNAIKFTNPNGKITIESKVSEKRVTLSITDNGTGMSAKTLNNLFKLDKQQSTPGTKKETGTGLGLIISKELVEKQDGTIWVESKLKKGSTFFFTLPSGNHDIQEEE